MAQHFITRAILDTVRARPGFPNLRVLDLSCGRGEILADLQRAGCEVRGTHFRQDDYEIESGKESFLSERIPIDTGVDLTQPLPYADGSFDLVILSEVVEHREGDLHAEGERDLFRWMTHPAMLASEQLLLIAEKRA